MGRIVRPVPSKRERALKHLNAQLTQWLAASRDECSNLRLIIEKQDMELKRHRINHQELIGQVQMYEGIFKLLGKLNLGLDILSRPATMPFRGGREDSPEA